MATTDKSRLYSWTGLRKTGAVPLLVLEEEGGAAKRIEVVDSVWTTKPSGTVGAVSVREGELWVNPELCSRATKAPPRVTHAVLRPASSRPPPSSSGSLRAPWFVLPSCGKRSSSSDEEEERSSEARAVASSKGCCKYSLSGNVQSTVRPLESPRGAYASSQHSVSTAFLPGLLSSPPDFSIELTISQ